MKIVDQIVVSFGDDKPKNSPATSSELGNSLLDLLSTASTKKSKKKDNIDQYYYGEMPEDTEVETKKEKKVKKKEKKKKSSKGSVIDDLGIDVIYGGTFISDADDFDDDDEIEESAVDNPYQIDVDNVFEDDYYDDEMDNIIYDQKKSYKKNKKSDGYMKQFAEELTLLYGLLEETNAFSSDLDKIYKALTSSKTRGFSKYTTDLINSILSTKQTKLSVLKEITSVKKTIADLTLKEAKNSGGDAESAGGVNTLAASYLNSIIKHGRNNFVSAMDAGGEYSSGTRSEEIEDFVSRVGDYEDDDERQSINDELMESLEESGYSRSSESDAYIRNESKEVTVKVQRDVSSGDWNFIAIDKNGLEVYDYPLPNKTTVSPVRFTADGTFCTDRYGRSYKVIELI